MRATSRFWTLATLPVFLVLWAIAVSSYVPVIAAAGVCAWLLATQYAFASLVEQTNKTLSVTQELSRTEFGTDEPTSLHISAWIPEPLHAAVTVLPNPPVAAETRIDAVALEPYQQEAAITTDVSFRVPGQFTFGAPTVVVRDRFGLFEQRFTHGQSVAVDVRIPRSEKRDIVNEGFAGSPTREGPERTLLLFVDNRASMHDGSAGTRKVDTARELALVLTEEAGLQGDRLGCYTIGTDGPEEAFDPDGRVRHFERIVNHLRDIDTGREGASNGRQTGALSFDGRLPDRSRTREIAQRLGEEESPVGQRLGPFFENPDAVVRAVTDRPLFEAVESETVRRRNDHYTVIVSDDANRTELREAVGAARRQSRLVVVFLLPTVVYDPGGLNDIETTQARYEDFEQFRNTLSELDSVSMFECGPVDRLSTVRGRRHAPTGSPDDQ